LSVRIASSSGLPKTSPTSPTSSSIAAAATAAAVPAGTPGTPKSGGTAVQLALKSASTLPAALATLPFSSMVRHSWAPLPAVLPACLMQAVLSLPCVAATLAPSLFRALMQPCCVRL
jgi:hypothetical protein